jgi:hypothetical protein
MTKIPLSRRIENPKTMARVGRYAMIPDTIAPAMSVSR